MIANQNGGGGDDDGVCGVRRGIRDGSQVVQSAICFAEVGASKWIAMLSG